MRYDKLSVDGRCGVSICASPVVTMVLHLLFARDWNIVYEGCHFLLGSHSICIFMDKIPSDQFELWLMFYVRRL